MAGKVLEEEEDQVKINTKGKGPNGELLHSGERPAGVKKQSGDAGSSGLKASAANPFSKVGISSTNV